MRTYVTILIIILAIGAVVGSSRFFPAWFGSSHSEGIKAVGWAILGIFILLPLSAAAGSIISGLLLVPPLTALFLYKIWERPKDEKMLAIFVSIFSIVFGTALFTLLYGTELFVGRLFSFSEIYFKIECSVIWGLFQLVAMVAGGFFGWGIWLLVGCVTKKIAPLRQRYKGRIKRKSQVVEAKTEEREDKKWFVPFLKNLDK